VKASKRLTPLKNVIEVNRDADGFIPICGSNFPGFLGITDISAKQTAF
jgi:hypothetical protein